MKKASKKIYCMPDFNAVEIAPAAVIASSGGSRTKYPSVILEKN